MIIFEFLFWSAFMSIIFHYVVFGMAVVFISSLFKKRHKIENIQPSISFIIAGYNEEKIIREKLVNDLNTLYPRDKIEFIVVSDGSTDRTPDIVREFSKQGVTSLHQMPRRGKTAALNRAVETAKNEIIIFSDANSMFRPEAIGKLVRHFADEAIGGVCGRKSIVGDERRKASAGDQLYWKYESMLKQAESGLGSIPTADGEIFALRKELFHEVPAELINDDLIMTFNILAGGKRVIYDQEAITEEQASVTLSDDFNVKSRMVYGGIQAIVRYKELLNPLGSWFGFQFFVHKTLRYFMWLLLVVVFVSNCVCFGVNPFYQIFFWLQLSFYCLALIGYSLDRMGGASSIFYFPYYYCNVNVAALKGFLFFLKQRSVVDIWKKAER